MHFTTILILAAVILIAVITGRNAGIKITHGAILRFFAPQERHVPPIISKFGTSKEIPYAMPNFT